VNAIFDILFAEVDDHGELQVTEAQVSSCLDFEYGVIVYRGFSFAYDFLLDKQIKTCGLLSIRSL